jgi:DNA polymerase-3 subunit epsilon
VRYVAIVDTETTGLDARVHKCIEIAVCLFDLQHASIVELYSSVLDAQDNPAEPINDIPSAMLRSLPPRAVWPRVQEIAKHGEIVLAHTASFDRDFIPATLMNQKPWSLPWVCTEKDIHWPKKAPNRKLISIALAHGLGISHAHRAATDVITIARLFERCKELGWSPRDMVERVTNQRLPLAIFKTNNPARADLSEGDIQL